jgi:hypothetical protein
MGLDKERSGGNKTGNKTMNGQAFERSTAAKRP